MEYGGARVWSTVHRKAQKNNNHKKEHHQPSFNEISRREDQRNKICSVLFSDLAQLCPSSHLECRFVRVLCTQSALRMFISISFECTGQSELRPDIEQRYKIGKIEMAPYRLNASNCIHIKFVDGGSLWVSFLGAYCQCENVKWFIFINESVMLMQYYYLLPAFICNAITHYHLPCLLISH